MLQQEHEHLSSSLTHQPGEALRQTNQELETKRDQVRSQEEQKTTSQNPESTMQEEVETGTSMTKFEVNLCDTRDKLQEKTNKLTRKHLKKINANSPSKKETSVLGTMSILQQIQSRLHESQRNTQEQLEMLNNMEGRLSELEDNLKKLEYKLSEQEEKQCNQVESLGDNVSGSELHSSIICPEGWRQIDKTCYYFSSESKVRIKAAEDCTRKKATLAKIQESDSILKAMVEADRRSFWIGLRRVNNTWKWSDESLQETFKSKAYDWCAKASPELESQPCATPLPWICQKKPRKY
ncbi:hypothetical protein AB205_0050930 [Aquarana catesbeiana]|uniref:C-type lectin domain-containing protein n=2 Tax=Aquarana catesbeiana TaxID=8400 RepID=A0A2G9RSM0_AQUCT|nr:hypothetical protein AB205_0050930 [Aquarana catesbeiana]